MRENRNKLKQLKKEMFAASLQDKDQFTFQARRKVAAFKDYQDKLAVSIPKLRTDLLEW